MGYNGRMVRKAVAALAFIVIAGAVGAYADTDLQVEAGFAGQVMDEAVTPVRVRVEHQGQLLEGRLVLSQTVETPWHGVFTETLSQPVRLGQRASQNWTLLFPLHATVYPLQVRLENESGEVVARQELDLRDVSHTGPFVIALSETGFPGALPSGETVFSVSAQDIPSHAAAFASIQRLYMGRFDPNTLKPNQQQALLHWVMLGGELVLLTGANWYVQQAPWLAPWLPLEPEAVQGVTLQGVVAPVLTGKVRGEVAWQMEGFPILLERTVGRGRIWLATIDPLAVEAPAELWKALQGGVPLEGEINFEDAAREAFLQQVLPYPGRTLIAALLGVFVGIAGLLTWWTVRRPLTWPALAGWPAVAGVALWLILQPHHARPLTMSEYGLDLALPDGTVYEQTWLGMFALRKEPLALSFSAQTAVSQRLPTDRGQHLFDLEYRLDPGVDVVFQAQPQQLRQLVLAAEGGAAPLIWTWEGDLDLRVQSPLKLERAWLLHRGIVYDLGALSPDKAKEYRLNQLPRLELSKQLPKAIAQLWAWALEQQPHATVLGAWHQEPGSYANLDPGQTYRLIVAEVGL
ncbi:MAG TPA: hypothetical protein VIL47_02875 [Candidatus Bipolaricaulota bacterium]